MIYLKLSGCKGKNRTALQSSAKSALFELLFQAFGERYTVADIKTEPNGKPYIKNSRFVFSYSHTTGAVAVAAAGDGTEKENLICINKDARRIGVDIEPAGREVKRKDLITERYLSPAEKEYVKRGDSGRFIEVWTKKESIAKATGEGLSGLGRTDAFNFPGFLETRYVQIGEDRYIISVAAI